MLQPLPASLKQLGNSKQWERVASHLQRSPGLPIVISGPTGCGKTHGVRELLEACEVEIVELDGADADSGAQLMEWIRRVRRSTCMKGPSALFLDDLESFTSDTRTQLAALLAPPGPDKKTMGSSSSSSSLTTVILTCNQFRHPSLRAFQDMTHVQLYRPNEHVCLQWFTAKRHYPLSWVRRETSLLQAGDLRRLEIVLDLRKKTQALPQPKTEVQILPATTFEATRRLLLRKASSVETWCQVCTEPRDVALLQTHLPAHLETPDEAATLERLETALESFSFGDACLHPDRYELREHVSHYASAVAASTARIKSRAQDVGKLVPQTLGEATWGHPADSQPSHRRSKCEWLDVPAQLGGPQILGVPKGRAAARK